MVGRPWKPVRPSSFGGRTDLPDITDPLPSRNAASGGLSPSVYLPRDVIQPEIHAHVTHLLAATAEKRVGLVDATDQPCPRFPAGRKPGTFGSWGIGRFVFRRDINEALAQDVQVGMPVQKLPGGLNGDDGGGKSVPSRIFPEECGKSLPDAQGKFGEKPRRRYRNAGRRTLGRAKTRCRCGTGRITCSRTNSAHREARLAEQDGQNPRCLQENATRYSFPQASHRTRAKPPSGRPQPKKRSTVFGTIPRSGPKVRSKRWSYSRVNRSKNW